MIEITIFVLIVSQLAAFILYLKERVRRETVESELDFIINRASDAFQWCDYEFPQIGDAVLFILAYSEKSEAIKSRTTSDHNGSVEQFRDRMRYKYINAKEQSNDNN